MTIYQAESASFLGPIALVGNGAQGSYLDYQNATGDYIEWTIDAPAAGSYQLSWRYANATGSSPRPLRLDINNSAVVPSLNFPLTSSWTSWQFVTQNVTLQAGVNTIRLTATGSSGANFDYMEVTPLVAPPPNLFDAIFEAESAVLSGPTVFTGRGAQGGAYADYQNATGDYIEWTVNAPRAGTYDLSWRYSNGIQSGSSQRPLQLNINGTTVTPGLNFPQTANWSTWTFITQSVALQAGVNRIRLTATGSSGANFDYLRVVEKPNTPPPINVSISDATATEGPNAFLVFDVALSAPSTQPITLDLATTNGSATGGVDFDNQVLEFSTNGGSSWSPAANGTQVTFAPGQTTLKVRLVVIDDVIDEPIAPETLTLRVANVVSGTVNSITDTGLGSITDDDNPPIAPGAPISPLPFTDIRVEGALTLDFDGVDGGIVDKDGQGIGFTMIDPATNAGNPNPFGGVVGYWPEKLDVDPATGVLRITTTAGLQNLGNNSLDNALGVGLNVPSAAVKLDTTLVNLPTPVGGNAQAGLWFGKAEGGGDGTSEDDYIKLVVRSNTAGNYLLEAFMEVNGVQTSQAIVDIPENQTINLSLFVNPTNDSVTAQYSVGNGAMQTLTTFNNVPAEWFSFDQAGINPELATRSFGGIFASHRSASSPQVFTFDKFHVSEQNTGGGGGGGGGGFGAVAFDRWSIPVANATDMSFGPDGKLYVATLFGDIRAITFDRETRQVISNQLISTIKTGEGGNRLTLGLAVDPDSTPGNVILWVAHSSGSIDNGGLNSGKLSRLSGPNFSVKQDVVVGLPRAIANHATNNIEFGPDGKLYLWQGGNTGAGAATLAASEFGDRPEQVLSAALLTVDIPKWKANPASFHGNVASPLGEFIDQFYSRKQQELGRPFTEVQVFASGLRNTYDGVFHSNGQIYAPDNGLGVTGTVPPVPRLGSPTNRNITTQLGVNPIDNPGTQADPLNRIVQGGYYGHPNPYRDEVVFMDGSFQGLTPDPDYKGHMDILGNHFSPNGIIEYTADNFFGLLQGDLLITNYSTGDNITRVSLSSNGTAVTQKVSLTGGFSDPLPLEMGPDGSIFVGEFNGGKITILESIGIWRSDLPKAPINVLDAGSGVLDGKLYMVGGKNATGHLTSMYIYDPGNPRIATDDTWTQGLSKPGPAVENAAVVGLNGKLYAFGGSTAPFSGAVGNSAAFTPDADPSPSIVLPQWNAIAPMITPRGGATAQVLNGDIYVIGGMDANGQSVNTVEIYDPDTNTWRVGPSLQTRRDNPGAAVIGGKLYVVGGRTRNADGTTVNGTLNTLEIFDPLTGQWTFGAPMPTGRRTMMIGTIGGRFQVIGGEANGSATFVQNEEYNPRTNTWRTLAAMNSITGSTGRHGAAFGTIGDVFYAAGGGIVAGSSFTDIVQAFTV